MQAPPLVGSAVAQLYRETLKRCRHLGGERGRGARLDAQHFYAKLRAAADGAAARAALEEAESRLAYLRMVTPRFRGARRVGGEDASGGGGSTKGSFVMRDGVLQASGRSPHTRPCAGPSRASVPPNSQPRGAQANGSKPISNWGGNNPDPDFVSCVQSASLAMAASPPRHRPRLRRWRGTTT